MASPRDKRATITSVTPFEGMTDAQLEVQRRLDDYIAEAQPVCIDILDAVNRVGRDVLEPLWELVSPIRTEYLTLAAVGVRCVRRVRRAGGVSDCDAGLLLLRRPLVVPI